MKRPLFLLLAISSLCLFLPEQAGAGTRPRYGGTARVQVRETLTSLDAVASNPSTSLRQELATLVFDRLIQLDQHGAPQPGLASSWVLDPQHRIWQFNLRRGVTFHDGAPLSAAIVASVLSAANRDWKVTSPNSQTVVIETDLLSPHLPELLSLPQYSIYARTADGNLVGTGPFKLGEFQPNRRLLLNANDDYWGGRPYLDAIEIVMGNSIREQLIDRRLDRDDVVELGLDQARALGWPGSSTAQRLAVSSPSDLYAIVFRTNADFPSASLTSKTSSTEDARVREALALTIDRAAISSVLLQKQGEPAKAFLPQWQTGYEFLFPPALDLERARKLRIEAARNAAIVIPLAYDSGDSAARTIAERIAVNAREANITVQPIFEKNLSLDSMATSSVQAVLVRLPLASVSSNAALAQFVMLNASDPKDSAVQSAATPEALYAAEHEMLQDFRIIPIAHVPQIYWLSPRIKNWTPQKEGGWSFKDAWLEPDRPAASAAQR